MAAGQSVTQVVQLNDQQWLKLRQQLVQQLSVSDGDYTYQYRCETPYETWRVRSLMEKEEGTVRWIKGSVRPGQVFYDVGANIGLYTLLAARRVADAGLVYAFEPHVGNVYALLHNVGLNQLSARVKVISAALNDREGFFDFNYYAALPGTSMSQLNDARDSDDRPFQPVLAEYKYATTVDRLLAGGAIRPPHHVKIDVDGNELLILRGMRDLLCGADRPLSLQIEINPRHKAELFELMASCGYRLAEKHYTHVGKQQLAAGSDPEAIAYNAIFQPAG